MTHDNDNFEELETRLHAERPEAPGLLVERLSGQVKGSQGRAASRARKTFAVIFASMMLSSSVVGIALAGQGGNGGGSNGNGNGDDGHPAACNESAKTMNPHCP